MAQYCNNLVWSALESCLIPPSATTRWYYTSIFKKSVAAVVLLSVGFLTGWLAGVQKIFLFAASFFKSKIDPRNDFSAVLDDSRLWKQLGDLEQSLQEDPLNLELMGPATCTYQDSGRKVCPDSQWAIAEDRCIKDPANRSDHIPSLFRLYQTEEGRQEIIDRIRKLNGNAFRLSIEWSHATEENIKTYVALCKALRDADIEVMITLLQFSEHKQFHQDGSFEHEKNIHHFVEFVEVICREFTQKDPKGRPLVKYFCTINEPAIDAFSRYVLGSFSPGYFLNFAKAGNFLKNALKTHTVVYEIFKRQAPDVKVGIVHQYLRFIPTNFLLIPITRYFTRLINEAPLNFFKNNGKFELKVPFLCNIEEQCPAPKTDFVGLQYYGHPVIGLTGSTSFHEPMTQMPMREDPEGLYEAIVETHEAFKVPVIITENGISTHDDGQRRRYMTRALYALREGAKKIGVENISGYFVWSLGRNLEWNMGMNPQDFGAYELTERGLAKEPKPGMDSYIKTSKAWLSWKKAKEKAA